MAGGSGSDDAGAGDGDASGTPQEGTSDKGGTNGTDGQEPRTETFDADYVKKLRQEAAEYRKRATAAEGKVKEFETAALSESEKLAKQAQEAAERATALEQQLRQERVQRAIVTAAAKAGLPAELAARLVDVEYDEAGNPQGVDAAVAKLAEQYPQLVGKGAPTSTTSATHPNRGQAAGGTFITSQLGDRKFYLEHKDEIMAALREGRIVEG